MLYTSIKLLGAIKKAGIKFDPLFLRLFFPRVITFDTKEIMLDKVPSDTPIAAYCSPKIKGEISEADGYTTNTFIPPYTKPKHEVELDRLLTRLPGESPINGGNTPESRRNSVIMDNLNKEEEAIVQLEEFQAVQAVLYGKITAASAKHPEVVISMGRSESNNITLTGSATWSSLDKATYDPDDDIETWALNADGAINIVIMDRLAWSLYKSFDAVKERLNQRRGSNTSLETGLKDLGMSVSYKGESGSGVHILVSESEYLKADKTTGKFLPSNTVVLGHTSIEGLRLYGLIQNSQAVKEGLSVATRYPRNWQEKGDPVAEYTQTESAPAMFLPKPNQFVVVTVD